MFHPLVSSLKNSMVKSLVRIGGGVSPVIPSIASFFSLGFLNKQAIDEIGDNTYEQRQGGCYNFDGINDRLDIPTGSDDGLTVSALTDTGAIASNVTISFSVDHYEITSSTPQKLWNIKVWNNGETPTDIQKKSVIKETDASTYLFEPSFLITSQSKPFEGFPVLYTLLKVS